MLRVCDGAHAKSRLGRPSANRFHTREYPSGLHGLSATRVLLAYDLGSLGEDDCLSPKPLALLFRNRLSLGGRPALRAFGRSRVASLLQRLLYFWRPVSNSRASPRAGARPSRTRYGLRTRKVGNGAVQHVVLPQSRPGHGSAGYFCASCACHAIFLKGLRTSRGSPNIANSVQFF